MIVDLPDPHPGRCKNHRTVKDHQGYPLMVRCLDYEATEHVCSFPPPPPRPPDPFGMNQLTYPAPKPEPWVKPRRAGVTDD